MSEIALILKALEFAAGRHRAQLRKGLERTPFINHPIEVASLLANEGGESDPVLLTAAILHDVIEDTVDSVQQRDELCSLISELFGEKILSLTLEVTDDKTLEKKERKRLQVVNASGMSVNARKLKIADKIMNLRDIVHDPPEGWPQKRIIEYLDWAGDVVAGLRGVNKKLEEIFDESLSEGRLKYGSGEVQNVTSG